MTETPTVTGVVILAIVGIAAGCGSDGFLGLEDYERDLLLAALIMAELDEQQGEGDGEPPAGEPLRGKDGLNCWDVNGNGEGDAEEDINGDSVFNALDCRGLVGPPGLAGADGRDGSAGPPGANGKDGVPGPAGAAGQLGADGLSCWDLDGDGTGDPREDANGDGMFDVHDCQGQAGPQGPPGAAGGSGPAGPPGERGPEFFDLFIDDLFTVENGPLGNLPIVTAAIMEPTLGRDPNTGTSSVVAYRVAIPEIYETGNDVTMRLFLHRSGNLEGDCFAFTLNARRLRAARDVQTEHDERWVSMLTADVNPEALVVVDLPVNNLPPRQGLGLYNDLASGDFLAFELKTYWPDGGWYHLIGVEFFESDAGAARLAAATVFAVQPDDPCTE